MTNNFEFEDQIGVIYRPKDREYLVRDGEYVRRPDGKMFRVIVDGLTYDPVGSDEVPEGATIVELVKSS